MASAMAASSGALCFIPSAAAAAAAGIAVDAEIKIQQLSSQRISLTRHPPRQYGEIQAVAPSICSLLARSGTPEVHGSTSSALRVASVYKSVMREEDEDDEAQLPTSALAIAAAAASVSSTPFGFLTKIGDPGGLLSTPSAEFLALCAEQLSLCEKIVGHQTNLTVYVRTAESYATCQLEFFLAASYPTIPTWSVGIYKEVLMLTDKSESKGSISLVESALVQRQAVELPDVSALVLPLVKDMFLVGLLVAERSVMKISLGAKKLGRLKPIRPSWPPKERPGLLSTAGDGFKNELVSRADNFDDEHPALGTFTKEQQAETAKIARTLALACVMDQRSVLLQQSSWQRGIRIDSLVDQVRGPLMAVRTLGKMLLPHLKRGEISRDVVEDILVQGDRMNEVVQQIQKNGVNSPQFDEDFVKDLNSRAALSKGEMPLEEQRPLPGQQKVFELKGFSRDSSRSRQKPCSLPAQPVLGRDEESPMPPLALAAPPQEEVRICNVSEILYQLVRAGSSLAQRKNQKLQLKSSSDDIPLMAAIGELSLRQALSNLLEYSIQHTPAGGWICAEVMGAPGGGVLVVIEDNGPDMGLVVPEPFLGPLGSALSGLSKGNTNNERSFEAGLRLIAARDVLEQSSAVLNIRSPYLLDAPIGAGGTRVEIWLPEQRADAVLHTDVRETPSN